MPLWTDVINPAPLTGYARAALGDYEVNRVTLATYLPNAMLSDISLRAVRGQTGMVDAALYRAYDAETPVGGGLPGARVTIDLPALGKKERLSEFDQLRSGGDVGDPGLLLTSIEKAAQRRARSVGDRIEALRGQVINTGSADISDAGFLSGPINFGRSGSHDVTAATLWSVTATASPLSDLQSWADVYRSDTGADPGSLLLSSRVLNAMMRTTEFRALSGTMAGTPTVVTRPAVQSALTAFGLPPITVYDRKVKLGIGPATTRVTPDNRVYLLPAPVAIDDAEGTDLGGTFWGRTLESADPRYSLAEVDQPGLVVGAYREDDPLGVWVKASAIALPALINPDLSFAATVL